MVSGLLGWHLSVLACSALAGASCSLLDTPNNSPKGGCDPTCLPATHGTCSTLISCRYWMCRWARKGGPWYDAVAPLATAGIRIGTVLCDRRFRAPLWRAQLVRRSLEQYLLPSSHLHVWACQAPLLHV